ncbi:hypothetical protein Tco_1334187, partial [Tanacetum coccineum]
TYEFEYQTCLEAFPYSTSKDKELEVDEYFALESQEGEGAGAGWMTGDRTRAVLGDLEICTWSIIGSGSRSTFLEDEGGGGGN